MNMSRWLVIALLAGGCTTVQATLPDGTTINVKTFAQDRQDIDIGRDKDGSVHWRASNSSADQILAKAIADLVALVVAMGAAPSGVGEAR